ncbi:hypothetical protein [Faecalibacterium prausnitzii]|uniref:hypothetical protein n=1 Tax=Faecalibacterium prausnitzii TaxID=853 RepID=UPI001A9BFFAF|nr:hypothetical protein [Faecalibacterium prausnitzii]
MAEKGRKDRKIGLFQPSKSPKIREKSRRNSPKTGKMAAKHRRRASLKGIAGRAELVTGCHRFDPARPVRGDLSSGPGRGWCPI